MKQIIDSILNELIDMALFQDVADGSLTAKEYKYHISDEPENETVGLYLYESIAFSNKPDFYYCYKSKEDIQHDLALLRNEAEIGFIEVNP